MPDRLESMAAFVRVADLGSFAAAAGHLGVSPQMIAKHVAALESRLGIRLINRTTRRQSLTEFGQRYCDSCRAILADVDDAEAQAMQVRKIARGILRVNAPVTFGTHALMPVMTSYLAQNPEVQAEVVLSDRLVDPVEDGYEAIIRIGAPPESSSFVARTLSPYRLIACASPAYLEQHGTVVVPDDLSRQECLGFSYWSGTLGREWTFRKDEQLFHVPVHGRLRVNDWKGLHQAALLGFGITLGPMAALAGDIAAGRLVQILRDYEGPTRPMHLLHAEDRRMTLKLRCFIDAVLAAFAAKNETEA
ncbi:LysR family transcriptional regulator [Nguyenibacter vanlangensis]|uniref:LysR family transcriptional regulator n=2 Tax=Nguyenibacter vanlangensis TaxID=1216886 RepID=A0A7Y7IUU5_9PROT|nr:LysR family transcriptional regulator [Nguyenibacter vanlangensis]